MGQVYSVAMLKRGGLTPALRGRAACSAILRSATYLAPTLPRNDRSPWDSDNGALDAVAGQHGSSVGGYAMTIRLGG